MTLLTAKLNRELQNYCFQDKVKGTTIGKRQRPGMDKFALLSITKEVIQPDIRDDGSEVLVWNEKKIHARTNQILEAFKEIWPYHKPVTN